MRTTRSSSARQSAALVGERRLSVTSIQAHFEPHPPTTWDRPPSSLENSFHNNEGFSSYNGLLLTLRRTLARPAL